MRIGVHCLCAHPGYLGGTNSFTLGLLDGFARVGGRHEFAIFVRPWNREMFARYEALSNFDVVVIPEPVPRFHPIRTRLPSFVQRRLAGKPGGEARNARDGEAIAHKTDLLYVPYVPPAEFALPPLPTVYSIHDIQHVHYPEFFTPEVLRERERGFARTVAHATVVQASSRAMAAEFRAYFPSLDGSSLEVIPEGVDVELLSQAPAGDVRERYSLPEAFLFTPAQLWHHKNHLTILRALRRLRERGIVLPWVLTGADYEAAAGIFEFVAANGLAEQVHYLGLVPFDDVIALHHAARFLVTASLYESSSLPVLEAAAAGTPIVASRIPPHEEMAEQIEMRLFATEDDADLADLLASAWDDDAANEAQVAANRVGVRRYSWDNAARMYIQLFERIGR